MTSRNHIKVRLPLPAKAISDLKALAETFGLSPYQSTAAAVLIGRAIVNASKLGNEFELWGMLHDDALRSVEAAADIFKFSARQQMAVSVAITRALDLVPRMDKTDLFNLTHDLENLDKSSQPFLKLVEDIEDHEGKD